MEIKWRQPYAVREHGGRFSVWYRVPYSKMDDWNQLVPGTTFMYTFRSGDYEASYVSNKRIIGELPVTPLFDSLAD